MDHWNDYAYQQIADVAKLDELYLNLFEENRMLELEYLKVLKSLEEQEQDTIERHIDSCENILYRFAQLAYRFGRYQNH